MRVAAEVNAKQKSLQHFGRRGHEREIYAAEPEGVEQVLQTMSEQKIRLPVLNVAGSHC